MTVKQGGIGRRPGKSRISRQKPVSDSSATKASLAQAAVLKEAAILRSMKQPAPPAAEVQSAVPDARRYVAPAELLEKMLSTESELRTTQQVLAASEAKAGNENRLNAQEGGPRARKRGGGRRREADRARR